MAALRTLIQYLTRLRRNVGLVLIGRMDDVDTEVDLIYEDIWPKHQHYHAANKARIRVGLLRARACALDRESLCEKYIGSTGRALAIVHGMASRLLDRHGELDPATNPAEARKALDRIAAVVEDTLSKE